VGSETKIPPRSAVQLVQTIDLGEYEYSSAPKAQVYWQLGYANRADRSGRIEGELPRRWLP
jgi:hypothetical protein